MTSYFENLYESLAAQFGNLLPGILGALVVLIVGLFVANLFRRIVLGLFRRTQLDERMGAKIGTDYRLDKFISNLVYYLLVLFVLLLVLDMMGVGDVLQPVREMLTRFMEFVPNVIAAGIIGFVGYMVAKIASEGIGFISDNLENYSERWGLSSSLNLTKIVKQVIFLIVFIPILIVALDALNMRAISEPATDMLRSLLNAIPNILAAAVILAVFVIGGRYVTSILKELLKNVGLDKFGEEMGLAKQLGGRSISGLVGDIAFFFLVLSGIMAAVDKLDIPAFTGVLETVFALSGKVFFGLVLLIIGNLVANFASSFLTDTNNSWAAPVVRFALLGMFLAIALHTMGVAHSIVNMAFGLTLGEVAVAFALAFGLGGREAAGEELKRFFDKLRK